jgi:hypothetical protein
MKKAVIFFTVFAIVALLFSSCAKPAAQGAAGGTGQPNDPRTAVTAGASEFSTDGEWANDEAVRAAFALDYRAQTPEAAQEEERLDLRTSSTASTEQAPPDR